MMTHRMVYQLSYQSIFTSLYRNFNVAECATHSHVQGRSVDSKSLRRGRPLSGSDLSFKVASLLSKIFSLAVSSVNGAFCAGM